MSNETPPLIHLAIIPDGNRRYARKLGMPDFEGHRKGAENSIKLVEKAHELGVKYITIWGLSTENIVKRSPQELKFLFRLFKEYLKRNRARLLKNNVRFVHIGRKDRLPTDLIKEIKRTEIETESFKKKHFIIGLDYGGQDEIVRAVKRFCEAIDKGTFKRENLNTENFYQFLDTKEIPPPDLIIRTSGEYRLSGLLPYQGVYAELYFTKKLFPEFTERDLEEAIKEYYRRQRRFGGN